MRAMERGVHLNVSNLGHVLARLGHFEEALPHLRESVVLGAGRLEGEERQRINSKTLQSPRSGLDAMRRRP